MLLTVIIVSNLSDVASLDARLETIVDPRAETPTIPVALIAVENIILAIFYQIMR